MDGAEADRAEVEGVAGLIGIELVYCPDARTVDAQRLQVPPGTTLAAALQASGLLARHGLDAASVQAGIWGRVQPGDTVLRDRDRIELYRPLTVDPKEARRLRYARHRESQKAADALQAARRASAAAPKSGTP